MMIFFFKKSEILVFDPGGRKLPPFGDNYSRRIFQVGNKYLWKRLFFYTYKLYLGILWLY